MVNEPEIGPFTVYDQSLRGGLVSRVVEPTEAMIWRWLGKGP